MSSTCSRPFTCDCAAASPLAAALAEFNRVFGMYVSDQPTLDIPTEVLDLRIRLIREEAKELLEALVEGDLAHIAKEAADLAYVLRGTTDALGIDLDVAVEEVHASNMSKLGADGQPIYNEYGKALKGPTYFVPDMRRTLRLAD